MGKKFTVIFYDEDRKTILEQQEIEEGMEVKYKGKLPEKPAENGISYRFVGWETEGNLDKVIKDIEVFAKYQIDSKMNKEQTDWMQDLAEQNAESANLNEVMEARAKS